MLSSCAFAPLFKISIIKERFLWLLLVIEKDQTSLLQQQQKELLAYSSPLTLPFYIYKASLKFHVSKAKSYHHYPTKHYVQIYIYVHDIIYIMYESVVGFFYVEYFVQFLNLFGFHNFVFFSYKHLILQLQVILIFTSTQNNNPPIPPTRIYLCTNI